MSTFTINKSEISALPRAKILRNRNGNTVILGGSGSGTTGGSISWLEAYFEYDSTYKTLILKQPDPNETVINLANGAGDVIAYAATSSIPSIWDGLPIASATVLGGIKVGANLTINGSGVLSANAAPYTLPIASPTVLGGIKIGTNLSIDGNGVVSASGGINGTGTLHYLTKFTGATTVGNSTITDDGSIITINGNRPISFNAGAGAARIKADAGGWAMLYGFYGSAGTDRGGFGVQGGADAQPDYWIGPAYNNRYTTFQADTGNLGIGIDSPSAKLHIKEATPKINIQTSAAGSSAVPVNRKIIWSNYLDVEAGSINLMDYQTETSRTQMAFSLKNDAGSLFEAMRIDYNGNVGIGTTSVSADKLLINSDLGSADNAAIRAIYQGGTSILGEAGMLINRTGIGWCNIYASGSGSSNTYGLYVGGTLPNVIAGNLGIGITPSTVGLYVYKDLPAQVVSFLQNVSSTGYGVAINGGDATRYALSVRNYAGSNAMEVRGNGDTSIYGNLLVKNEVTAYSSALSDRKLKTNIKDIEYSISDLMNLRSVSYNLKSTGERRLGFIAQEVQEVMPEVVKEKDFFDDKVLTLNYQEMIPLLVKSIQELKEEINELRKGINNGTRR